MKPGADVGSSNPERAFLPVATVLAAFAICFTAMASVEAVASGMTELADEELADVDARTGIAVDLSLRINMQENGTVLPCPVAGVATDCRLALSLSRRDGMWTVVKDFHGLVSLNNVWLDGTNLPANWTAQTSNGTVPNPALGGFDPRNKPSVQLSSGAWQAARAGTASALNLYLNADMYNELAVYMNIGQISAEFNCGGSVDTANGIHVAGCNSSTPGWIGALTPGRAPGYLRNAVSGGAISLRIADGIGLVPDPDNPPNVKVGPYTTDPARFRVDGRLQLFGY
jgi:hypothetical protein